MKEHKYRAWNKKGKRWLGINLQISVVDGLLWWQYGYGCETLSAEERENIELVQYTNKKDKHNDEIYEGHILKYENKKHLLSSSIYVIKWNDEECGFVCERQKPYNYLLPNIWHECKIIGHIYENPELVGEDEK